MIKNILFLALGIGFLNPAYSSDTAWQEEMLASHNKWRQSVNASSLAWSESLAKTAQTYADSLKAHQGCKAVHSHTESLGENLFWASAITQTSLSSTGLKTVTDTVQAITSSEVTDAWGSESSDYSYGTNSCATGKVCGHYTQIVWRETKEVGCGNAVCDDKTQIWVCNYSPPGNYIGQKPY